jgi:hypothetical protein
MLTRAEILDLNCSEITGSIVAIHNLYTYYFRICRVVLLIPLK